MFDRGDLTPGRLVELACILEVTAPKPGNVHRGADFEDVSFDDFLLSAIAVGNCIDRCELNRIGCGELILSCIQATKRAVGQNTNLGIVLLLTPMILANARSNGLSQETVAAELARLNASDCQYVYEAIRLAQPGGMGTVKSDDVSAEAPSDLIAAMKLAENRDMIARQYVNGFEQVFGEVTQFLNEGRQHFSFISQAIVFAHVKTMATFPDSLIGRKNGNEVARHSQFLAAKAIDALEVGVESYWHEVSGLDLWLRSDGNRRNPGTTADLIAAGLLVWLCGE